MASIVKRKNKWAVIYSCDDENGVKRQKWESFATNAEAKKRKAQIEFQQATGTFIVPSAKTVSELLSEYVSTYGINTWAASTYESKRGLIDNYVLPIIGDVRLDDVNPRMMNSYYQKLLTVKAKSSKFVHPQNEFVTVRTVKEIHAFYGNSQLGKRGQDDTHSTPSEDSNTPPATADKAMLDAETVMNFLKQSPEMLAMIKQIAMQAF